MTSELSTIRVLPPAAFSDTGDDFAGSAYLLFDGGKRGTWTRGRAKEEVQPGTRVVALLDELLKGYVKYVDGVPQSRMVPIWPAPDLRALRASLGDTDPALWPDRDARGDAQDPWRTARRLPVIVLDETCEGLIFSTSSFGGVKAISLLSRELQKRRRDPEHAGDVPIVELNSDSYNHPVKSFGRILEPRLDVVGWTVHAAIEEMLRSGNVAALLPAPSSANVASPQREGAVDADADADHDIKQARARLEAFKQHRKPTAPEPDNTYERPRSHRRST
jgi:hypothetical protein